VISGLERVSRLSRRVYADADHIPDVFNGLGVCILTTPQGVITGHEARKRRVGGEVLCKVW
jgi:small subunit ribosomal protein S8